MYLDSIYIPYYFMDDVGAQTEHQNKDKEFMSIFLNDTRHLTEWKVKNILVDY